MLKKICVILPLIALMTLLSSCDSDNEATTELFHAVENKNYELAESIIKDNQESISLDDCKLAKEETGSSSLLALAIEDQKMSKILIDAGAKLDGIYDDGATYIQFLIYLDSRDDNMIYNMKLLLDSGADANYKGKGEYEGTALDYLIRQNPIMQSRFDEIYNLLIKYDVEIRSDTFNYCMLSESRFQYANKLLKIMDKQNNSPDISPTLRALLEEESDTEILKLIKNSDYNKNEKNNIMLFAAANCGVEVMKVLEHSGFDLSETTSEGLTLLDISAMYNDSEMIEYLMSEGMYADGMNLDEYSAVYKTNNDDIEYDRLDELETYTPLSLALICGRKDNVDFLLKKGAEFQNSSLLIATTYGNKESVDILLEYKFKSSDFYTFKSYKETSDEMVQYMLGKNIDPNLSLYGETLLSSLLEDGYENRYLLVKEYIQKTN